MTGVERLPHMEHLRRLEWLAHGALERYALPAGASVRLINVSENATYRVDAGGQSYALRVHREGYHGKPAIASELAWAVALRQDGAAVTPIPVAGRDGALIQTVDDELLPRPRDVVLFQWESGIEPSETQHDLTAPFEILGEIAARMHLHAMGWRRPPGFERHRWDFETSIGERPHWGRWRDGMGMTPERIDLFGRT